MSVCAAASAGDGTKAGPVPAAEQPLTTGALEVLCLDDPFRGLGPP